jgi:hypothetical protein
VFEQGRKERRQDNDIEEKNTDRMVYRTDDESTGMEKETYGDDEIAAQRSQSPKSTKTLKRTKRHNIQEDGPGVEYI